MPQDSPATTREGSVTVRSAAPVYRFADLVLDSGQRRLLRGHETIRLSKLCFALLRALVEAAPDLLTHDELANRAWGPKRIITPENLSQRMALLRQALGDDARHPRYVEGVRGEGYRLLPDVEVIRDTTVSPRRLRLSGPYRYALAVLVVVALAALALVRFLAPDTRSIERMADQRSVAVLPFANLGPGNEDSTFVDGIHDDIITQLAKISTLKVTSRTSAMEYRDRRVNLREIGEQLGVGTILEGAVQRAGHTVRINVQLLDARTDEHLWAERYDRDLTTANIFAIQMEIATAVAEALEATVTTAEMGRLRDVPTQSTRAYDFFLSGKEYERRGDTYLPLALRQFERAVGEDAGFALAWARLAMAHVDMYWFAIDRDDARRRMALAAAKRALALRPGLPEGHVAMALYHYHGHLDYEAALRQLEIAAAALPGNVQLLRTRGAIHRRQGRWKLALADFGRAIELDPRNLAIIMDHGVTHVALRDYDEADRLFSRALELAPDNWEAQARKATVRLFRDGDPGPAWALEPDPEAVEHVARWLKWQALLYRRDHDAARSYVDGVDADPLARLPASYIARESAYGLIERMAGRPKVAERHFLTARAQLEAAVEENPDEPALLIALAEAAAFLGDTARALELARRAMTLLPASRDALYGSDLRRDAIVRVFIPARAFDLAIEELDAYLGAPGEWSIEGLLPDPHLDPLRGDPRFVALVEKYRRR